MTSAPTKAPAEAIEAAEDVDGKPDNSEVSSLADGENRAPAGPDDKGEEGAKNIGHMKEENELVGCGVCLRPRAWPWRHAEEGVCQELDNRGLCVAYLLAIGCWWKKRHRSDGEHEGADLAMKR